LAIFIAYIWTLSQVVGFYSYFSVPSDFISLNPTTVLSASRPYYILPAFILCCIFTGILLIRFVEDVSSDNPSRRLYLLLAVSSLPTLIALYLNFGANDLLSYIPSALVIIGLIGIFVFRKKLIAQHKRVQERRQANGLSIGRYWNDLVIFGILFAVGVVAPSLFYLGKYSAEKNERFYVVKQSLEGKGDSESIFLGNYGDYLVTVPFTRITRKNDEDKTPAPFKKQFILVKMSDAKTPLSLSLEKVGPLKPEKPVEVKPSP
jgi:hypothetical protein